MQKVLVLGLGISGMSIAKYLCRLNIEVIGVDQKQHQASFTTLLDDPSHLDESFDAVVKSPGIISTHPILKKATELKIPVISDVDCVLNHLNQGRFIGVTGTVGKTTTVLFLEHLFQSLGYQAVACGNVGKPLSDLDKSYDFYILELSSFQLEILKSKKLDVAVILNLFPNHLDFHGSFENYLNAKLQITKALRDDGLLILGSGYNLESKVARDYVSLTDLDQENIASYIAKSYSSKKKIYRHDLENFATAMLIAKHFGISITKVIQAIETFVKPPHRLEFLRSFNGVDFINDSKATTPEGVIRAVEQFSSPVHLIAGGKDKGLDFSCWKQLQRRVKAIYVIGEAQEKIATQLQGFKVIKADSLKTAVAKAYTNACKGESVILSPGCASFDMFKNYEERGEAFRNYVNAICEVSV